MSQEDKSVSDTSGTDIHNISNTVPSNDISVVNSLQPAAETKSDGVGESSDCANGITYSSMSENGDPSIFGEKVDCDNNIVRHLKSNIGCDYKVQNVDETIFVQQECIDNACHESSAKNTFATESDVQVRIEELAGPEQIPSSENTFEHPDAKLTTMPESYRQFSSTDSLSCSDVPLELHQIVHNSDNSKQYRQFPSNPSDYSESESLSGFDSGSEYRDAQHVMSYVRKSSKNGKKKKQKSLRNDRSGPAIEYYEVQLEFLENNNRKLLNELSEVKSKFSVQETEFRESHNQLKVEFEAKFEKLSRLCDSLKKDKESMVIRYANSEKEVILAKKMLSELEKKMKDASKDRDNLNSKIKTLQVEKARMSANMDVKVNECATLQRDIEKLKEELSCKDIKIKWIQNKLKTEMDSHKDTQGKLDHTIHRLQETREEAEQVRKDCQEMIRRYQEAEEIKSVKLDHQLKQKLSELEVQKQERSDQEEVYQLLRQELEALKKKQRITIEENNSLTVKIHSLERERLEYEQTLSKLKDNQNSLKQEVVDLTARLAEMDNLSLQLEREKEKVSANVREVERLRQTNAELQSDMDACHMKEGELLEFTERLTAKTVHLQSEHSLLEVKAQALEEEVVQLNKQISEMDQKITNVTSALEEEQKLRLEETQLLARKLAEKAKAVEQLKLKLDEADNENRVMKRRHITSIKELSRELQQCKKKMDVVQPNSPNQCDTACLGSRTSSSASLDTVNNAVNQNMSSHSVVSSSQVQPPVVFSAGKTINTSVSLPQISTVNEINKQLLIERIVKLQKTLAKKNDKIEFLEDHIAQLVKEMKKKSKIIQNYVLKTEPGALIPSSSDMNKLALSKRGGIMASVYRSQLSDNNMTLELSLEINNKLQAVLEDTLLKNITLKENINTLGEEIARLTAEKRELNHQMSRNKNSKICSM